MAEFFYKASDRGGKVVQGFLEAVDQAAVIMLAMDFDQLPANCAE